MNRLILKAKIHRATVTETNIGYDGSLTLDEGLMKEVDLVPFEQVHVYNISNGERFITYIIKGQKDSGIVGVNGAAAHKASLGDKLIIVAYSIMDEEEINFFIPKIILLDDKNNIESLK
ncbi:MAG: aspartate 1-decarboxylase [Candidatus Aminicenantes bacterium]|jgi:aspartate 1-decarboxylase|nr:aspartate 1-decarboxylase [Candidatus Aminicenantes bacterium]MDH5742626.1 aspartate 1-decarboxylase [Candidatus Aminicenantes bacterium]